MRAGYRTLNYPIQVQSKESIVARTDFTLSMGKGILLDNAMEKVREG